MLRRRSIVVALMLGLAGIGGNGPETPRLAPSVPADFKLVIALYGVGKEPIRKTNLVVHEGRAFHFDPGPPLEVILKDPGTGRLELLNLKTKVRSEVSFKKLDEFQTKLHRAITAAAAKREAQGGKANQVAAKMSRDLIDPRFSASYDDATHRLRLSNATVEVEASGEPESDGARLASIHAALAALVRLEAARNPTDIPPFPRLEALRALIMDHRLRPTEMAFVYHLAGTPQKLRWTFRMEPSLTTRELEAMARVEAVRERCRFARFERYGWTEKK